MSERLSEFKDRTRGGDGVFKWGLSVQLSEESLDTVTFTRDNPNRGDFDLSMTVPRYIWEGTLDRATVLVLDIYPRDPDEEDCEEEARDGGIENRLERVERELAQLRRESYRHWLTKR